jgi:hypothetical protein
MISDYYETQDIMKLLKCSRQHVSVVARREEWESRKVGNSALYDRADVYEYVSAVKRTGLAHKLGVSFRGLLREDKYDTICPKCGGFAIVLPVVSTLKRGRDKAHDATFDAALDRYIQYLSGSGKNDYPWLCENGHGKNKARDEN